MEDGLEGVIDSGIPREGGGVIDSWRAVCLGDSEEEGVSAGIEIDFKVEEVLDGCVDLLKLGFYCYEEGLWITFI